MATTAAAAPTEQPAISPREQRALVLLHALGELHNGGRVREKILSMGEFWHWARQTDALWQEAAALVRDHRQTPALDTWRERGEPDPHGTRYDCAREQLAMGHLSDDELANEVFLKGDRRPSPEAMSAGEPTSIVFLTAAKDRIRWLSRRVAALMHRPSPERLLEIARETNLREHMHGVPPVHARVLLDRFVERVLDESGSQAQRETANGGECLETATRERSQRP